MVTAEELFGADQATIHQRYNDLRESQDGIHVLSDPKWRLYFRHHDVSRILKDPGTYSSDRFEFAPISQMSDPDNPIHQRYAASIGTQTSMLMSDPPEHTRLRGLVRQSFTPSSLERMRAVIAKGSDDLLDVLQTGEEIEFMSSFAQILPVQVITEILGVPAGDRAQFRRWSDSSSSLMEVTCTGEARERAMIDACEFREYLEELVADRRKHLTDDLLSLLISAEEHGDRLQGAEIYSMITLLLFAGNETTINLLGNGLNLLLDNPHIVSKLVEEPDQTPSAVEEMLRLEPSFRWIGRVTAADGELDGEFAPKHTWLYLCVAAANRDPRVFDEPDEFRLDRPKNKHLYLAFGAGIHYCLGAPLARLEGTIAFTEILRRFPNIQRAGDPPNYTPHFNNRHPEKLHVVL